MCVIKVYEALVLRCNGKFLQSYYNPHYSCKTKSPFFLNLFHLYYYYRYYRFLKGFDNYPFRFFLLLSRKYHKYLEDYKTFEVLRQLHIPSILSAYFKQGLCNLSQRTILHGFHQFFKDVFIMDSFLLQTAQHFLTFLSTAFP